MIGPYICMVKIHVDIFENYTSDWGERIRHLADEFNFLIIEDRKYSDIGNTSLLQHTSSTFKTSLWADIITAYAITGEDMIRVLGYCKTPILLVAQLSTKGSLLSNKTCDK